MKRKGIANLNDDRFVEAALDPIKRERLIHTGQSRRNIYLGIGGLSVIGLFLSLYSDQPYSVFPPALVILMSFTLVARHDTQLKLLKIIRRQNEETQNKAMDDTVE